jgi:Lar family restriction alleviation protein
MTTETPTHWTGLEAKPCPFCGGREIEVAEIDIKTWAACCRGCNSIGPHRERQSILGALDAWNTRPAKRADAMEWLNQALDEGDGVYRP